MTETSLNSPVTIGRDEVKATMNPGILGDLPDDSWFRI